MDEVTKIFRKLLVKHLKKSIKFMKNEKDKETILKIIKTIKRGISEG